MTTPAPFGRLSTAMVTPFKKDLSIDWDGVATLAQHLLSTGHDAIIASNQTANLSFTVNAGSGPAITTQPANQTACVGGNATFTIASTGTYQWQVNTGSGFSNIAGATASSYTASGVTASMSGNTYRCLVAGQCGTTTSTAATLTVNTLPAVVTQPTNVAQCTGTSVSFSAVHCLDRHSKTNR